VTGNLPGPAAESILATCFDVNAPRAQLDNIDELASKVSGSNLEDDDDEDEENEAVGF
jgi:hypothetical protein